MKKNKRAATGPIEPFVGTEEVCEFLGKPRSWLYNRAERIGIPRYRVGLQYRYRLSEVVAWVEQGRLDGGGAAAPPEASVERPVAEAAPKKNKKKPGTKKPDRAPAAKSKTVQMVTVRVGVLASSEAEAAAQIHEWGTARADLLSEVFYSFNPTKESK
jgi:excisionase family DNA binding protein